MCLRSTHWQFILQPTMMSFFLTQLPGDYDKEPWSVRFGSCRCSHSPAAQSPGQLHLAAHPRLQRQSSGADTRQPDPSSWHYAFRFVTSSYDWSVAKSFIVSLPAAKQIHRIFSFQITTNFHASTSRAWRKPLKVARRNSSLRPPRVNYVCAHWIKVHYQWAVVFCVPFDVFVI